MKLGTLEHLDILCCTYSPKVSDNGLFHLATPTTKVLRRLFLAYRHAFYNYSE